MSNATLRCSGVVQIVGNIVVTNGGSMEVTGTTTIQPSDKYPGSLTIYDTPRVSPGILFVKGGCFTNLASHGK